MRQWGATLTDLGYHVLPIWPGDKKPGQIKGGEWCNFVGWQKYCERQAKAFELQVWSGWEGCGIGIACGAAVIGVDLDIMDQALASQVQKLAVEMLGATPAVRVGQHPKALLVYRVEEQFQTIKAKPIEVLGHGAQFVAYGIHPKTGQPYQWIDEGLADLHLSQLPKVRRGRVEAFVTAALELLPEEMKAPAAMSGHDGGAASVHGATATFKAVAGAAAAIPNPDLQWDDWSRIGMAIWAATRGSEQGYEVFHDWSDQSAKHCAAACRERWDHWHRSPPSELGFGTLCYEAQRHGWVPPADIVFDETLAVLPPADFLFEQARAARPAAPAPKKAYQVPPELLDLDGGLKAFVDWCVATAPRPQPFLALAAALPMFGALTGRRYRSRSGLRGNVYTVAIADSGGGKDHARKAMSVLMHEAGLSAYLGGDDLGSGQAILGALAKHAALLFRSDEFGKQLKAWTSPKAPSHKADIWTKLTVLYSSADSVMQGTEYANQKERPRQDLVQPCACFYGTTVPLPFWDALKEGALRDGSLARFLVFRTDNDYPERRTAPPLLEPPEDLMETLRAVVAGVPGHDYGGNLTGLMEPSASPRPYTVPETPDATAVFDRLAAQEDEWLRQAAGTSKTALVSRMRENAIKAAMVRAVARDPERPVITGRDAQWGAELADHCLNTALADAESYMAENETEADVKRLLGLIREAGEEGITRSKIGERTLRIKRRDRNEILSSLEEMGLVVRHVVKPDGRGRPTERFYGADLIPYNLIYPNSEEQPVTH